MKTHCPRGHELTDDNLRRRTGKRAGHRECLICCRAADAARQRKRYRATDKTTTNRRRKVRQRAKRLGLRMVQRGNTITVYGADGNRVESGGLDYIKAYLAQRFERQQPGPPAWSRRRRGGRGSSCS